MKRRAPQGNPRPLVALLSVLCALLVSVSAPAAEFTVAIQVVGTPHQVARLRDIVATQLPSASAQPADATEPAAEPNAASPSQPDRLLVRVDVTDAAASQLRFTRGELLVLERRLPRDGASDEVHFQELALLIRSAVEALRAAGPAVSDAPLADHPKADATERASAASAAPTSQPTSPQAGLAAPVEGALISARHRTPLRLDFQALYAATAYAKDPSLLFGIGLGLELVLQRVALNPGFRLLIDNTSAFEFSEARPRVAHLRGLASVGVERWLPARWGLGLSLENVLLHHDDERTAAKSLLATSLAELKLPLSDRVDGVLGSTLDVQLGDSRVSRGDGEVLERHRLRFSLYLGLAITAAGER